ncbi:MAG: FAD-dependent oxidoreductase, partial [Clostridia bacterium]|nr:FAD-dependent oxidoreductase [Clostridia bacterium]
GCKVEGIDSKGLFINMEGQTRHEEGNSILISTGRRPRVAGFGLENLGLDLSKGRIETSETMETAVKGVYAAGDVNGKSMLAHTAYREAEVAIENIAGGNEIMCYDAIPSVVYTNPEAAWIGLQEEELQKLNTAYEAVKVPMMLSGRYAAEGGSPRGVMKLFREKGTGRLLGAHALGNGSSEFIFGAALIMGNGLTVDQASKTVFPHPTVGEVMREGLQLFGEED